jgi:hypothetical protein
MAMSDKEVRAQLERMVQFIKKEAEEKAQEIKDKAHEEFSIEKQRLVQAEKLKILKEYERKEKQVEVQRKMCAFFLLFIREPAFRFPPIICAIIINVVIFPSSPTNHRSSS